MTRPWEETTFRSNVSQYNDDRNTSTLKLLSMRNPIDWDKRCVAFLKARKRSESQNEQCINVNRKRVSTMRSVAMRSRAVSEIRLLRKCIFHWKRLSFRIEFPSGTTKCAERRKIRSERKKNWSQIECYIFYWAQCEKEKSREKKKRRMALHEKCRTKIQLGTW